MWIFFGKLKLLLLQKEKVVYSIPYIVKNKHKQKNKQASKQTKYKNKQNKSKKYDCIKFRAILSITVESHFVSKNPFSHNVIHKNVYFYP